MREWLVFFTEHAITLIDALALIIILFATLEAFVSAMRIAFKAPDEDERRHVWLRYARWLVAALTFSLPPTSSKRRSRPTGQRSAASARSR